MADPRNVDDDLQIEDDEREEIEREIDELVAHGGRELSLAREYLQPRRSGVGLPLLIWCFAVAAVVGGFFYVSELLQVREESIVLESRRFFSTEAQLIEEILRASEERLAAKDEEIGEIQSRLIELDAERRNLEQNLQQQVSEREAELRAQLEAELEAERRRLADAGETDAAIEARIAELEAAREAEVAAQVDAFRAEAQRELAALQGQLAAQQSQLEQTLAASREEREILAAEAAQREAQLRAELGEEIRELEEAERLARARIGELQRQREEEQLLADRIIGSFAVIVTDIEEGRAGEALAGLNSVERLLRGEPVGTEEARRRRQTELALAGTLRSLVQEIDILRRNIAIRDLSATEEETAQIEQERAAELIRTTADTVALAERAREEGRLSEARTLYQQALATIPSLEKVYPGILDLESARRQFALQSALSDAQSLLAEGRSGLAVERYLEGVVTIAANEDDPLLEVASAIDLTMRQAREQMNAELDEAASARAAALAEGDRRIASLTQDLTAARNTVATANATIASLRTEAAAVRAALVDQETLAAEQATELAALRREITVFEDQLQTTRTELAAARTRAASLQESLNAAGQRSAALADEVAALETRAATLQRELDQRPEAVAEPTPGEPPEPTDEASAELRLALEEARAGLASGRAETDALRADLEEERSRAASLQERLDELRASSALATGEAQQLEQEIARLRRRTAELEALERDIRTLREAYDRARAASEAQIRDGRYPGARTSLLAPFEEDPGRSLLPGFVAILDSSHRGIVDAAARTADEASRAEALAEVRGLATQVQQNIDRPRESISVQSYLRRHPDLRDVATGMFEIVELSARAISAPEIEYRLLGSVSRITGNLVVVERLVALSAEVGDTIEIRRAPTLGQEVQIASGTVLEVTDRRIVVNVTQVYQPDAPPSSRDLAYIAVE